MIKPKIETVNLSKHFGSFYAVSNLNLKIEGSKCVGFLGPNGAGKTTTFKMFTGLIRPSSGKVLVNDFDVTTSKKEALSSMGAIIETPEIYPYLTPREALMMIAKIRGIPQSEIKKNIENSIAEVHMEDWTDKRIGKFSTGMKRRICIASALIGNPNILFLDEPTNGLDPRGMSEIRDIIKDLKRKNRLIFMSSHLLSEVSEICDEVAMIDHSKLLYYGSISDMLSNFPVENSIIEVGLRNPIHNGIFFKDIENISNVNLVQKMDGRNFRIFFNGDLEIQENILAKLVGMNIGVISYKPTASALENVYLKLIKDVE